jgi:hypothetical protein
MSKSTPINQLPNILMNDPQRGAVPSNQAPSPSADDIIQETLSQLQQVAPPQQPQRPATPPQAYMPPPPEMMQQPPPPPSYESQQQYYYENEQYEQEAPADPKEKLMLEFFNSDIKIALIAAACFILITMLPVDKLVYRYIDLQKVPYSGVVIKAVIMFIVIYLLQRHFRE